MSVVAKEAKKSDGKIRVRKEGGSKSVTDLSLLIASSEMYMDWDDHELSLSIQRETGVTEEVAKEISGSVRERVQELADKMGWTSISTSFIRELVEQELLNKGRRYKNRAKKYRTLGLSEQEITGVIENDQGADNGNLGHNPDAVLFVSAENMMKQYALKHVFPEDVVDAHLTGDISLHDLGAPFKVYCGSHSVEYIKKNGLNLNTVLSKSLPARSASVLVNHMLTFSATIQNQFAGAVGFDAVNVFFAPFFVGKSYKEIKQVAQELFYGFSQSAFSRGGQSLFSDLNFYLTIPPQYYNSKAIGPGGKYVKLVQTVSDPCPEYVLEECRKQDASTYSEFERWAQIFVKAVLEVCKEGDSTGMPFAFPKCLDGNTPLLTKTHKGISVKSVREVHEAYGRGEKVYLPRFNKETRKNEWVLVRDTQYRGIEDGVEIKLGGNVSLASSPDHRYPVLTRDGLTEKLAMDLTLQDILVYRDPFVEQEEKTIEISLLDLLGEADGLQVHNVKRTSGSYSARTKKWLNIQEATEDDLTEESYITGMKQKDNKHGIQLRINEDWGMLLGYFVSEGSFDSSSVAISAKNTGRCFDSIQWLLKKFGYEDNYYSDKIFKVHDNVLKRMIKEFCPSYKNHASQKEIPSVIFESPKSVKESFLRGLFHGDGTTKTSQYYYATASYNLALGVRILLSQLGIYSSIYSVPDKKYGSTSYGVSISGRKSLEKAESLFSGILNPVNDRKCNKMDQSWYNRVPTSLVSDLEVQEKNVYNYELTSKSYLSRDRLNHLSSILEDLIPLQISEIKTREVETYAIEVDHPEHDFITAHGVMTKNCDLHIDKKAFLPENEWVLDLAMEATASNGSPYLIFDRGDGWKISQCCRLQREFSEDDQVLAQDRPEDVRFQALQNVSINFPRIGYRYRMAVEGDPSVDAHEFVRKELRRLLEMCVTAHKAKKRYIKKLMNLANTPLHLLKYGMDGKGYMDLEKATYLVGLLGLNEMVQIITGKELHESDEALEFGLRTIAYLSLEVNKLSEKEGIHIVLEESPAESTSKRLAKLDEFYFNGLATPYIKGNHETGAIYYTNSIHLREDSGISFVDRIRKQSKFHQMVSGGSIIHLWVGENLPDPSSLKVLVKTVYEQTRCTQLTISPEFTLCEKCLNRMAGLRDKCDKCGLDDAKQLTQITRVVGYFSRVSNWVDSKKEELAHREHDYAICEGESR